MKILVINWQDRENPQAGGAEVHLHEVFGRIAARGHQVDLLCSGFPDSEPETELDGIRVFRVGTRYTFPMHARGCSGSRGTASMPRGGSSSPVRPRATRRATSRTRATRCATSSPLPS